MKIRKETFVLYLAMFVMGSCGIAYEYTLSKMSSDLLGNSVKQWAIVIGLMMFCMGVGADFQKHFKDKALFDKFIFLEILLGFVGGFSPLILLFAFGYSYENFAVIQYGLVILIGMMIGLEIPIVMRLNKLYIKDLKINIGGVLKMDYLGSFAGAIAWVFLLMQFFTPIETGLILGIINVIVGIGVLIVFREKLLKFKRQLFFALFSLGSLLIALYFSKNLTLHGEQRLYANPIIFSANTKYQHIVLTKSRKDILNCYINGHLQFSSFDEHIYHENLVHPAMNLSPKVDRILILGGGDGLALREVLKFPDVKKVVLCDLDPEMTNLATNQKDIVILNSKSLSNAKLKIITNQSLSKVGTKKLYQKAYKRMPPKSNKDFQIAEVDVYNLDAVGFLDKFKGKFDVIIADFPDPSSLELSKLYTVRFYTLIADMLVNGGVFVQQSTSTKFSKESFLCIGRSIKKAGLSPVPYHDEVPSFGDWGWWIAQKGINDEKFLKEKLFNINKFKVSTKHLSPEKFKANLIFGKQGLSTSRTDLNKLMTPVLYNLYLKDWEKVFGH